MEDDLPRTPLSWLVVILCKDKAATLELSPVDVTVLGLRNGLCNGPGCRGRSGPGHPPVSVPLSLQACAAWFDQ